MAITPRSLVSEKLRFPIKVIFSISVTRPSVISKTRSILLSDFLIILGVTCAARRPLATYALAILSASRSTCYKEKVLRSLIDINSLKFSSLMKLLPSKFIELIVGFSFTIITI